MLSYEDNQSLIRTGPGTPMGSLMRRYWIPALMSEQIKEPDCPPVRVRLLSENLVAFRDTKGRPGLVAEACPHRLASMFFARNEDAGLRCVYHGAKFDVFGNCVDMPVEPATSTYKSRVRIAAYPCIERAGIVWTYMGPPELQPGFPALEWTLVPDSHRYVTRHIQECNWLQALEGGFDVTHLTFLHGGSSVEHRTIPPYCEVIPIPGGFIAGNGRDIGGGQQQWSASIMLMPFHKLISAVPPPVGAHIWVPIDDENTMLYSVDYDATRPLRDDEMQRSYNWEHIHTENIPGTDYAIRNRRNNYLIDRDLQKSGTSYTGLMGFGIQDCAIQESMGPIADRTQEHLASSDAMIVKLRRMLLQTLKSVQQGGTPPGLESHHYHVRPGRFKCAGSEPVEQCALAFVNSAPPERVGSG